METTNYNQFTFFKSNREVSPGLVRRLMASIKKHGYIKSRPIIVNKEKKIIDGQNRFIACKELKIPIVYAIEDSNGESEDLMIDLNANQDIWRLNEYVNHWAEKGISYYIKLRDFDDTYHLGISNSIIICTGQHWHGGLANYIRAGKPLKFNDKSDQYVEYIKQFNGLSFYKGTNFVRALVLFLRQAGTTENKNRLLKKHLTITKQGGTAEYIAIFENIINKGKELNNRIKLTK